MRQYSIWTETHGTAYANDPAFGGEFSARINVGSGSANSYHFASIRMQYLYGWFVLLSWSYCHNGSMCCWVLLPCRNRAGQCFPLSRW